MAATPRPAAVDGTQIGLRNVAERLALHFGDRACADRGAAAGGRLFERASGCRCGAGMSAAARARCATTSRWRSDRLAGLLGAMRRRRAARPMHAAARQLLDEVRDDRGPT